MRGILLWWLVISISGFSLQAPALADRVKRQYNFREYTVFDGLPQGQALALAQDKDGYIWIGTYAGLSRYNGNRFDNFSIRDGLPNNTVRNILSGRDGRLVFGTSDGVCFRQHEKFQCVPQGARLIAGNVMSLLEANDGSLWIATDGGITHYFPQHSVHYTSSNGLPNTIFRALALDHEQRLWAGSAYGVFRLKRDHFIAIAGEHLANKSVRALLHTEQGMWVGTTSGLFLLRDDQPVELSTLPEALQTGAVLSLFADRTGNIWIGTYSGVYRYHNQQFEQLSPQQGLPAIAVYSIFEDREGNIWMGTDQGVSKYVPGPFVSYTDKQGLGNPFVRAMAVADNGDLWIGTRDGVSVFDVVSEDIRNLREALPMKSTRIFALQPLPNNQMLIGTQENLTLVQNEKVVRHYFMADGLPADYVSAIHRDASGQVWLGTARGLALWHPNRIEAKVSSDFPITAIYALKSDRRGRLWIGTGNIGMLIYDPASNQWQQLPNIPELGKDTLWSLDVDAEGNFWIGTNGLGLFQVSENFQLLNTITAANNLNNDYVWQVKVDRAGRIWAYTNQGLTRIENERFTNFDGTDGLVDLEGSANAIIEHPNGDMWFGTGKGLNRFTPGYESPISLTPPVLIERVSTSDGALQDNEELSSEVSQLHIQYASPMFRDERDIRFKYRLLGASDAWSMPTNNWQVIYPKLAPGQYEFQVLASDNKDQWSAEPATFRFGVQTPLWQRPPFLLLYGLLALLSVYLLMRWRFQRLQRQQDRLEREIEDRTLQLKASNAELNRLVATDHLTRIYNRRHLMKTLHQEVIRLSRSPASTCLALLLIDADHFKDINDSHGHTVGDEVLIAIAERMSSLARATDVVARFGGEEFALLLPMTDQQGAVHVAQKLLAAIRDEPFTTSAGVTLSVTVSIGYALLCNSRDNQMGHQADELIKAADTALYRAKRDGRDCARGENVIVTAMTD